MAKTKTAPSAATKLALANARLANLRGAGSKGKGKPNRRKSSAAARGRGMLGSSTTQELIAGTVLGWLQSAGHLAAVPTIAALGTEGTIALVGIMWARNGGPPLAGLVGRVAGIVAANHFGRTSLDTMLNQDSSHAAPAAPAAPVVSGDAYADVGYDDDQY